MVVMGVKFILVVYAGEIKYHGLSSLPFKIKSPRDGSRDGPFPAGLKELSLKEMQIFYRVN